MTIFGGTTPTHTFTLPFDTATISEARVLYAPRGSKAIIVKETEDCVMNGSEVSVRLTQEDTLKLDEYSSVYVQLRVLLQDGTALASTVTRVSTYECLEEVVIE